MANNILKDSVWIDDWKAAGYDSRPAVDISRRFPVAYAALCNDWNGEGYYPVVLCRYQDDGTFEAVPAVLESDWNSGATTWPQEGLFLSPKLDDGDVDVSDSDLYDLACSADHYADRLAEEARDYDAAWQAGSLAGLTQQDMEESYSRAKFLFGQRRKNRATETEQARAKLADMIADIRADIRDARRKIETLENGAWGGLMFWPGDDNLKEAFKVAFNSR
jgi:hypothetical protein